MTEQVYFACGVFAAYLIGALPFGYLAGKIIKGIDIRQYGSGNLGATNVARILGGKIGAVVLILDAAKGLLPVLFIPTLIELHGGLKEWFAPAIGIAVICGHNWPVYLNFRGGKGVASTLGVVIALSWQAACSGLAVFVVLAGLTRYVSVGSILAGLTTAAAAWYFHPDKLPLNVTLSLLGLLIVLRHRSNIVRLMNGTEKKFGEKDKTDDQPLKGDDDGRK